MDAGSITAIVVAVVGAAAGPFVAYKLGAKRMSGEVDTSAASELWAESRSMREDYQRRLVLADKRASELETEIRVLEEQIRSLASRLREMRKLLKLHGVANGTNGNDNGS